jgi:endonuclease YncB( thermonuclease family)
VTCEGRDNDRYGRLIATCHADGQDLNAALVLAGAAFAYRRYSTAYVAEEQAARVAGRGIWSGAADAPEAFRRRIETSASADGACRIKGNISAAGRIYPRPGQQHYDATKVDTGAGERWFCS